MRKFMPIRKYKNFKQLRQSLSEWQKRLFLDSWIIFAKFHKIDEISEAGHVDFLINKKTAVISLLEDDRDDRLLKRCQELDLVHELLHLKFGWLRASETLEGNFYEEMNHQLIEEMARSLIMAKYKLNSDWFKNF